MRKRKEVYPKQLDTVNGWEVWQLEEQLFSLRPDISVNFVNQHDAVTYAKLMMTADEYLAGYQKLRG
ncbi:hypothetical protein [Bradyrhizobium lablabi]|uniref:hypothetical protein n=1 Tax=Bradyrhizobium lablabi TaxID=722472 RepID=UPI001BAD24C7|nr:hypothetical protein [Bradyrhizobium lablabi]MBR0691590.1 hypothetical protein [Bradyrhizobium lablabi]